MEAQPRFVLKMATDAWLARLEQGGSLSGEDVRELESHLRDAIADLQQTGLSEEEAFWVASRRLGPAEVLEREFSKLEGRQALPREALLLLTGALGLILLRNLADTLLYEGFHFLFLETNSHATLPTWNLALCLVLLVSEGALLHFLARRGSLWPGRILAAVNRWPVGLAALAGLALAVSGFTVFLNGEEIETLVSVAKKSPGVEDILDVHMFFWIGFYGLIVLAFLQLGIRHTSMGRLSLRTWVQNAHAGWLALVGLVAHMLMAGILVEAIRILTPVSDSERRVFGCLAASFVLGLALAGSRRYSWWVRIGIVLAPIPIRLIVKFAGDAFLEKPDTALIDEPAQILLMLACALVGAVAGLWLGKRDVLGELKSGS